MGILFGCPSFSRQSDVADPVMFLDKLKFQVTQQKEDLEQLKVQTLEQEDGLDVVRAQSRGHAQTIEVMKQQIQDLRTQLEEQDTMFSMIKKENQLLKQDIATMKTQQQKRIKDLEVALLLQKQENHTVARENQQHDNGPELAANALEQRPEQRPTKGKGVHRFVSTTFVWRLANFEQLVKKSRIGKQYAIISDPFYTGPHGYKMRVRIYPNGHGAGQGTHLSAYIIVMMGEYDAILSWPFVRKVRFSIIDQEGTLADRKNIEASFKVQEPSQCFGRPQSGENEAYGFQKLASLEDLKTRKYVVEGNIFIQVDTMDE